MFLTITSQTNEDDQIIPKDRRHITKPSTTKSKYEKRKMPTFMELNKENILQQQRNNRPNRPSRPISQNSKPIGQNIKPLSQNSGSVGIRPISQNRRPIGQNSGSIGQSTRPISQNSKPLGHKPIRPVVMEETRYVQIPHIKVNHNTNVTTVNAVQKHQFYVHHNLTRTTDVNSKIKTKDKFKTNTTPVQSKLDIPKSNKQKGEHPSKTSFTDYQTKNYMTKIPVNKIKEKEKVDKFAIKQQVDVKNKFKILSMEQQEIIKRVTEHGLRKMRELYDVEEPKRYHLGVILDKASPGGYVAAFNSPRKEMEQIARFGYASVAASKLFRSELMESRQEQLFENLNVRKFPAIPLINTTFHEQCPRRDRPRCSSSARFFRTADGTCNNIDRPWWGATFQPLQRFQPPSYSDGIEQVRGSVRSGLLPSPRLVSTAVHRDRDVSLNSITHIVMQWGQFLDHDIASASQSRGFNGSIPRCCEDRGRQFRQRQFRHPDCLPIEVASDDWFYGRFGIRCLEFVRSAPASRAGCALGTREQVNQATSFIDGSMIYGNSDQETDDLRLFRNGMLRYTVMQQRKPLLPSDPARGQQCRLRNENFDCFVTGDRRFLEQPGLVGFHTLFLRLHNRLTRELAHLNKHWSDERLFQETRKIVGAIIQHITYREFLPIVLGQDVMEIFDLNHLKIGYYKNYEPKTNPTLANAFVTAAFRFGHSLVQGRLLRWDFRRQHLFPNGSLHEEMRDGSQFHRFGSVDGILVGMCEQTSQRRDEFITEELTNHLFESPSFPAGLDLAAINIQRGRDHGLPGYNFWRAPCGLREFETFEDLTHVMPSNAKTTFNQIYRHVDDIDLFSGGMAEFPVKGGLVGSTFACIIGQQFRQLRRGDKFWYENGNEESSFTPRQLEQIRRVSLARIMCDNLDLVEEIQPFVFLTVDTLRNKKLSCRSENIPFFNLNPWKESFDLKSDSKWNLVDVEPEIEPIDEIPKVKPDPTALGELPKPMQPQEEEEFYWDAWQAEE